ncbi:MAG TPA: hypothetical protein VF043_23340 [Ktedonobacteraceae bacterium]
MPARHLLNRLMLAWMALCLLIISLLGSVSQVTPIATASYEMGKDFGPPILSANPSNFIDANHCQGNQNQGWQCGTLLTNESSRRGLNWSTSGSGINGITFNPPSGQLPPNGITTVAITVPPTTCPASATFNFIGPANAISAPWSCLTRSPSPTPSPSPSATSLPTPSPTPTLVPSPTISPSPSSSPSSNASPVLLPSPTPDAQSTPASTVNGTASNDGTGGSSTGIFMTFIAFILAMLAFLLYLLPARQSSSALLKRILTIFVPASFLR